MEGLDGLPNLEELYLSHNGLSKIEGLENNVRLSLALPSTCWCSLHPSHHEAVRIESSADTQLKLRTLDIGNNEITVIENVSHLTQLEEFWASYNKIESIENLHEELGGMKDLETVYLEGNPCQRNDMAGYRRKIMLALPQVKQIDAT